MSFLTFGKSFSDVSEQSIVPAGRYDLRISSCDMWEKDGKSALKIMHDIEGHPNAQQVSVFLNLPGPDDDDGKVQFKLLLIKRYLTAFGIPMQDNGFDPDDLLGATGNLELRLSEPRGSSQTIYNEIVIPRLKEESFVVGMAPKKAAKR